MRVMCRGPHAGREARSLALRVFRPGCIRIEDAADERVAVYMNQKDAWLAIQRGQTPSDRAAGLFMAEGELVVRTLVESGHGIHSLLLCEDRLERMGDVIDRVVGRLDETGDAVPVYVASRTVVEAIVGFDLHRGVLCAGVRPVMPTLESLFVKKSVLLVLEDLANHDNMGGLFRSLAALAGPGRAGVVLSPRCCDPLYRKALRVSMGCALRVEWAVAADWPGALGQIASAGYEVLAMTPGEDAEELGRLDFVRNMQCQRIALVLGAEGPGLSKGALDASGRRVKIPIDPSVDSLNVGVAGAIALAFLCQSGGRNGT